MVRRRADNAVSFYMCSCQLVCGPYQNYRQYRFPLVNLDIIRVTLGGVPAKGVRMMMGRFRCKSDRGFTLIQLLVVIAVIVILIAFALPMLHQTQRGSGRVTCASNLKQIGLAMIMYMN